MRHAGASKWHAGSLTARTRKARKTRGRKIQSRKDIKRNAETAKEQPWQ